MAREKPTTAYTEVQIDEDSVSLTLITESGSNGAVVEDTERLTFDELESMAGEIRSLRLSTETREAFDQTDVSEEELVEEMGSDIEKGDILIDDNPAPWSDDEHVMVEKVTDIEAQDYNLPEDDLSGNTVATANPSYPDDDRVIEGRYPGSKKTYAFPESRLVEE